MQLKLNSKDSNRRELILFGNVFKTLIVIALPLMLFNAVNSWFSLFDAYMASYIGADIVSSVAYLNQIKNMIAALGTGISLAGSMLIAKYIGAHDLKLVKEYVNTMIFLTTSIGFVMLVVVVLSSRTILSTLGMPLELIETGLGYFHLEMVTLLLIFVNLSFIAIERAKGNTKKVFQWNMVILVVKLVTSLIFVFVFTKGVEWLAIASILAQLSLTISGTTSLIKEKGVFGFDWTYIRLEKRLLFPLFSLAIPIFMEKFVFSFGKVFVNSMSTVYGSIAIGALGISNNLSGLATTPTLGVQEAEASMVSQNVGYGQLARSKKTFFYALLINFVIGIIGMSLLLMFSSPLVKLFGGSDQAFTQLILKIFRYEALAIPLLGVTSSCMGFLYGMGKTKLTMALNMIRLLGYRIPVLLVLIRVVKMGPESLGVAMMISNGLIGITAITTVYVFMREVDFSVGNQSI